MSVEDAREYRKTATIRASQWWQMGDHPAVVMLESNPPKFWIDTLEGGHFVTPGDWIATGVKGEHWPIKPDIFAATYEPVDASDDRTWPECLDPNAAHNRRALRHATEAGEGPETVFCVTCGGEFDAAEWRSSSTCPECEQSKSVAIVRAWPSDATYALGDMVQKKGRASWRGRIVGWYRTDLTALGYAVESIYEPGSVQIYPESGLLPFTPDPAPQSGGE